MFIFVQKLISSSYQPFAYVQCKALCPYLLPKNRVHLWRASFYFQEKSIKIGKNPFAFKKFRTLFPVCKCPTLRRAEAPEGGGGYLVCFTDRICTPSRPGYRFHVIFSDAGYRKQDNLSRAYSQKEYFVRVSSISSFSCVVFTFRSTRLAALF